MGHDFVIRLISRSRPALRWKALAQARQAPRYDAFGPHLRESPLQEGEQARLQVAFLQQQVDPRRPALQVEACGGSGGNYDDQGRIRPRLSMACSASAPDDTGSMPT
jgi:hypothetical protein